MLVHACDAVRGGGAVISIRAKSERGMDLVAGASPVPVLTRKHSVAGALATIVSGATMQAISNIPAAAAGTDIEVVHQFRVALRRLRSGMALFKRDLTDQAMALDGAGCGARSRRLSRRDIAPGCAGPSWR